ncbi:MAG: anthranilate/aminodeoxychorismate synthase component II, partial [Nanoarchaeota archaeon]
MRVLVIDNLDLFTYNLVDELEKKECEVLVYGNGVDMKIIDNAVKNFKPKLIVISSGAADEPGISIDVVRAYQGQIPIFGV